MREAKDHIPTPERHSATESGRHSAHLGIDVSKAKLDVCLLRLGKQRSKVVANTPAGHTELVQWLQKHEAAVAEVHVCMEATGPYSEACAIYLCDAGATISIVNPARIKGFGQSELVRNKTDEVDAGLIARFCATIEPEPWQAPSPQQRKLRAWVDRLQALQDNLQQERNRQDIADPSVKPSIQAHIAYLEQAIAALQRDIDDHINANPELKESATLLQSIDAVGTATIRSVLAYAGDVSRFESAKAFAAFVGVAPRKKQSGSLKGRTVMGKGGSNALRKALFMPAMVALRHNDVVKALGERLQAKGMAKMAIIGAAMHKLAHLIYGVIKQGQPYRADWVQSATSEGATTEAVALA